MFVDVLTKDADPPWEQWLGAGLLMASFIVLVLAGGASSGGAQTEWPRASSEDGTRDISESYERQRECE
jgi:hypothetical protein